MNRPARVSSGVPGLDEMTDGGFLRGDAVLIAGSPGTGKSTLGLQFLITGIRNGEPGVLVTFEYLPQQLYRDAAARGWDLPAWEEEGLLRVICTTPEVLLSESSEGRTLLDHVIAEVGARRIVLDSLNHFESQARQEHDLRVKIGGVLNRLRLTDVTPLLTYEVPEIMGPTMRLSRPGLEFLTDAVVVLRYVEFEGELQKAINVLKLRGSGHDRRYRHYDITSKGMVVNKPFHGIENISQGSARRSVAERARELI